MLKTTVVLSDCYQADAFLKFIYVATSSILLLATF